VTNTSGFIDMKYIKVIHSVKSHDERQDILFKIILDNFDLNFWFERNTIFTTTFLNPSNFFFHLAEQQKNNITRNKNAHIIIFGDLASDTACFADLG
jgi:hypothetical protein